jgi:hypothetical protein
METTLMTYARIFRASLLALGLCGCGGSEPPPQAPEPTHAEAAKPARPALQMKSELGTVDPDAVKRTFRGLESQFTDCQKQGLDRVEVLAGSVKCFVRIAADGSAKYAYLEDTELGDRATEKCLLDAVNGAHWPKPDGGGEAEARYGMELPLTATRAPNDWSSDKVTVALTKHHAAIEECKAGGGTFHATMYVGSGGHVLAAGVATPGKDDADKADCLANVLTKMKGLPSPGSWPAKVSFSL